MLTLEDIKAELTVAQYEAFIENVKPAQLPRLERMYYISEAIISLFNWQDTSQGYNYWSNIATQLRNPPLPSMTLRECFDKQLGDNKEHLSEFDYTTAFAYFSMGYTMGLTEDKTWKCVSKDA